MTEFMYAIEKGHEIPWAANAKWNLPKSNIYPFEVMDVGDSFFVPDQGTKGSAVVQSRRYGQAYGQVYTSRSEGGGVRIWRIE